MKKIHLVLLALLGILAVFAASAAEDTLSVQIHNYDSEAFADQLAKRVDIFLSVTDPDGDPVTGLTKDNFSITENSVLQEITSVESGVSDPVRILLMIDNSQSIGGYLPDVVRSAGSFLEALGSMDEIALMTFNESSNLLQTFTLNHSLAASRLGEISSEQRTGTCIYDAAYEALTALTGKEPGRRSLVLLTDGKDERYQDLQTCSRHTKEEIEKLAGSEDIPVYVIGFGSNADRSVLSSLAVNTGGVYLPAANLSDVSESFKKLNDLFKNEYKLSYISIGSGIGQYVLAEVKEGETSGRTVKQLRLVDTPLVMSFQTPFEGEDLEGEVRLSVGFLLMNEKAASVKYYYKGEVIGESITYPFVYNWDVSGLAPEQNAVLEAVCYDKNGAEQARTSVTVNIPEPAAAEMLISSPEEGAVFQGTVPVMLSISGTDTEAARVEFYANGKYLDRVMEAPFSYDWDISKEPAGSMELLAVAYSKDNTEIARSSRSFVIEPVPAPKGKSNLPVLIGIGAGVVVIGVLVFVLLRKKGGKETRGTAAPARTTEEIGATTFVHMDGGRISEEGSGPSILLELTSCEDETMEGKQFHTNKLPITIGRSPDNDVRLSSREVSVSRYHAQIEEKDGFVVIQDSGSKYGTFVNNKNIRTEPCRLKNDDVIKLGRSVRIRYRNMSSDDHSDEVAETAVGFHLANATLMADTERSKIVK